MFWLFVVMTAAFVSLAFLMFWIPGPKGLSPANITKPMTLLFVKAGFDALVAVALFAFWWWDPTRRHGFLNSPLFTDGLSWIRFDTPCVRQGSRCGFTNTLRFFWHALFWSSVVTRRWWPWVDPCVSATRATVDKCVPKSCDEKDMCECVGYKDIDVMWSVIGIDVLNVAVAMLVLVVARFTLFQSRPFMDIGDILTRGGAFAAIVVAIRLVIEMANMLFENDTSLASTHLPANVASELNACEADKSAKDIIATCLKKASTLLPKENEEDRESSTIPKTIGKLIALQAQTTTIVITFVVLFALLVRWGIGKFKLGGDPKPESGTQTDDNSPPPYDKASAFTQTETASGEKIINPQPPDDLDTKGTPPATEPTNQPPAASGVKDTQTDTKQSASVATQFEQEAEKERTQPE